jgi:hypothetical protein
MIPHKTSEMNRKAIIICDDNLSEEDKNVCKILEFFEIPFAIRTLKEFCMESEKGKVGEGGFCVLGSARVVASVAKIFWSSEGQSPSHIRTPNSVFVYHFEASPDSERLLKYITENDRSEVVRLDEFHYPLFVDGTSYNICGALGGLYVKADSRKIGLAFRLSKPLNGLRPLISHDDMIFFLKARRNGIYFFLLSHDKVIDIQSSVTKGWFDVKEYFLSAVPLVMYLKWAFRDIWWRNNEIGGCLIIDDPLLKPRYGFFDFKKGLDLMDRIGFCTNIAFIPWNWRRSSSVVADFLKRHKDKYSLSIHGCDHTAGEFGRASTDLLNSAAKLAKRRMESLRQKTGCDYDSLMVFPQGVFSTESAHVLKYNNLLAAVNTEVSPRGQERNYTKISEAWDIAIMQYHSFPIFTRRYPEHGIENFAFDILLGKPCLIVVHHDYFKRDGLELAEFIKSLNSLQCDIKWHTLGEVIRNSFKLRREPNGDASVRMYGNQLNLVNSGAMPANFFISKRECEASDVRAVAIGKEIARWRHDGTYLNFEAVLPAKTREMVRIEYSDVCPVNEQRFKLSYSIKNYFRRHLSEVRDNYLCKNDLLYKHVAGLRRRISELLSS